MGAAQQQGLGSAGGSFTHTPGLSVAAWASTQHGGWVPRVKIPKITRLGSHHSHKLNEVHTMKGLGHMTVDTPGYTCKGHLDILQTAGPWPAFRPGHVPSNAVCPQTQEGHWEESMQASKQPWAFGQGIPRSWVQGMWSRRGHHIHLAQWNPGLEEKCRQRRTLMTRGPGLVSRGDTLRSTKWKCYSDSAT